MTIIESKEKVINKSQKDIFDIFSDLNNLKDYMPTQVEQWESTTDTCSFTIKNLAVLSMKITERVNYSKVVHEDTNGKPFKFFLIININEINESSCKIKYVFEADLNFTLQLLASKPLENFLNLIVDKVN